MIETTTLVSCPTPKGHVAQFATRDTTNDAALVFGIMGEDEYRFGRLEPLSGVALDIGAHIGIVTVMLALDHPDLRVIAVEAVPDNAALVRENVRLNGLADRVEVLDMAMTDDVTESVPVIFDYEWVGVDGQASPVVPVGYVRDCRYVGNIFQYPDEQQKAVTVERPGIGLAALLDERGIDRVSLAKIDCEGCEWAVLTSPAVARIDRWVGEFHGNGTIGGRPLLAGIHAALDATHVVTAVEGAHEGLFDAVRR